MTLNPYKINFINNPPTEIIEALYKGLEEHAVKALGAKSFESFGFLTYGSHDKLIAGCTVILMYGVLYIKLLWVDESERGKGLGRALIEKAEAFARENQCRYITVDTFSWQAKDFYEKMGYTIEHVYDGYDDDSKFYFFRKKVSS